ncbi:IS630 family transposase [Chlorogloea sp. CCALA 695]|uniref:IS630 family transposase n=1 Tax=Chlorogloea sp. CCALA 695 TaxID=2107693 RepID=UPI000D05F4E6|nr:IS630 family transposase [Chlorogloea sp. CCALA 695]PSB26237.1 IS630 family transposase [Chlorogloea sp. CCALA 695]
MKPYSIDFRAKVVKAYERGDTSIRKLAAKFDVSKAFVQRLLKQKKLTGEVQPQKQGGRMRSQMQEYSTQIVQMVENYPDLTLSEYCEYWGETYGLWVSTSTMCRALQKQQLTRKKRRYAALKQQRSRVQKLRGEYWERVKDIEPYSLVFLDETGVLLGLTRTHARSPRGMRVYDLKPFYRGARITVIGAISLTHVVALMTLDGSMDGDAFKVFVEKCLVPQLWSGAVVVMDNLPAHKIAAIEPMIKAVGANVLNLSPYSPDFNPIELWWLQLKSFLRQFSPPTTNMVDILIATALDLVNPKHLRNWFTNCCYCTH